MRASSTRCFTIWTLPSNSQMWGYILLRYRTMEWCFAVGCVFWGLVGVGKAGPGSCFVECLFWASRWRNNERTLEMNRTATEKGELTAHSLLLKGNAEKPKCRNRKMPSYIIIKKPSNWQSLEIKDRPRYIQCLLFKKIRKYHDISGSFSYICSNF